MQDGAEKLSPGGGGAGEEPHGVHGVHRVLSTTRGPVEVRVYWPELAPRAAALLVGGVGGGFDTPARGLYVRLAHELPALGAAVLRVRFRDPTALEEAVHDVRAGVETLLLQGVARVGLVGHSFGGAVVIAAAAGEPVVRTVVTLASQSAGAGAISRLAPRPVLLVHGLEDRVLPAACSRLLYERAREPRTLRIFPHAGHNLDEVADEVHALLAAWLIQHLAL